MRSKLLLMSVLILLLMGAGQALSQTVSVSPDQIPQGAYVNGPGGDADDNYFFQKLTINLVIVGGLNQDIIITLPANIDVADVDMDTDPDNEISLSWTGTGVVGGEFGINALTDESVITIDQNIASLADDWVLYVMFPIKSTSSASGTQNYGVAFTDGAFTPVAGPTVTYRKAGALQIQDFLANLSADDDSTTANGYLGLQYPNPSVASYDALNDYVEDLAAVSTAFQGILASNTINTDDITYYVWVATDSTLSHVSELEGGVSHAENYDTPGDYSQSEGAAATDAYYTGGLPEGEYYFFVTSSITGDFPLFRSGKLTVLHYPKINLMGWDRDGLGFDNTGGHADDLNLTLDTGNYYDIDGAVPATPNSASDTDLYTSVDDLDDNARVYLFYSTDTALTESDVTTSGTSPDLVVSGLTGATALVDTLYENQEDIDGFVSWNWAISTTGTIVSANSYTLYAVSCDGKHFDVQKAQGTNSATDETITIKHSPNLIFDVLTEYNLGTDTDNSPPAVDVVIDPSQSDVIMLSWGKASGVNGDIDIDDSATIAFYIDYDTLQDGLADYGSQSADAIETAASAAESPTGTHLIVSGLLEDPEGKSSSYHEWNLKEDFTRTGWYPNDEAAADALYHLYAIIDEDKTGGTKRVVCLGDDGIITVGDTPDAIEFDLDAPFSRLADPPAEGVTVNAEETYRFNFNAFDYDDDGDVGIFIVEANTSVGGAIGPATATILELMAATVGAGVGTAYCLTDNNGDHTAGGIWLSENSATYYDLTLREPGVALAYTTDMNGDGPALIDGTYWVYIGVDPNNDDFTTGGGTEIVYRAPGPLTIVNTGVAAAQRNMTVSPTHLTIAQGDTITYTVRAADNGGIIDRIDTYIAVEKDYWTVVNSTTPFTAAAEYSGQLIANTVIDDAATNRWILRMTVFKVDGALHVVDDTGLGESVATFQLVSKGTDKALEEETSVYYVNEPANGWVSKFSNDGGDITINTLASNVKVVPRAIIEGIAELQGRTSMTGTLLGLELRERDSYVCVPDTAFYNTNGGSQSTGVLYTLDNEGKFTLTKVPTGEYDLVAVYNRYLAKAIEVNVYPGVDTLFVSFGQLLGGDCMGYTDSSGAAYPDNMIDTEDINRVSSAFLATPDSSQWDDGTNNWKWADINEDNVVEAEDLSLVTANSPNNPGAQPVYKTVAQPVMSNMDALVEFTNIPKELKAGETYTIQVMARNTSNVRAYFVDMNYDMDALTFAGIIKGDFIKADSYSFPVVKNGTVGLANSVFGNSISSGDGLLAEVQFKARHDGTFTADMLGIRNVTLVNGDFMKEHIAVENPTGLTGDVAPVAFDLGQNFPNPFNPTTTISFTIPENENISLKIYDILGRNVRTLINGGYAAGSYNVVWDAADMNGNTVSAGIYFYTIKAGNYVETRRMLFIK